MINKKKSNQRLQTLTWTSFEWCIFYRFSGKSNMAANNVTYDMTYDICVNLLFLMDRWLVIRVKFCLDLFSHFREDF